MKKNALGSICLKAQGCEELVLWIQAGELGDSVAICSKVSCLQHLKKTTQQPTPTTPPNHTTTTQKHFKLLRST